MGNLFSICGVYNNGTYGMRPFGGFMLKTDGKSPRKDFEGLIADHFGLAEIKGSFAKDDEIEFMKKYSGGREIDYSLKLNKEKDLWLGEFKIGSEIGTNGRVMCHINPCIDFMEIQMIYLSPEEQAKILVDEMVRERYFVESKNPETGEDIILPGKIPEN